jgi:serine/threonine-protein kinase
MARSGPLLTLGAVAALGGALLAVTAVSDPAGAPPAPTPAAAAGVAPPEPVAAVPEPAAAEPPPAEPPAVAEVVWAGRSAGDEVTVAVAVRDGRAIGYVCDGDRVEAWLEGTLTGSTLELSGPDGAALTGTVDATAAFGSVSAGGGTWPYAAAAVSAPEGLYDGRANVDGVAVRVGWIALDGTVTGGARAAGEVVPAPPLDPTDPAGTVLDGVPVAVTAVDGGSEGVAR